MHSLRRLILVMVGIALAASVVAQKEKREPLTEAQIEQIREAGIDPNERVRLYVKFIDEHANSVKGIRNHSSSAARNQRMDEELLDFTALLDEFGSNLDVYSERKADVRKALKPLPEAIQNWQKLLDSISTEKRYDISRKEAIESCQDIADQVKELLSEQTAYFDLHKDKQGQDRAEPR